MKSSERRRIIRDLIEAVAYLHSRGVVHRDLKPSNVMIRDVGKEVVVIDFGLADTSDYVELKGGAGAPGFISPEQMKSGGADPADDIYSIGVIMKLLPPAIPLSRVAVWLLPSSACGVISMNRSGRDARHSTYWRDSAVGVISTTLPSAIFRRLRAGISETPPSVQEKTSPAEKG